MQPSVPAAVKKENRVRHDYTPEKARFVYLRRGAPGSPVELCINDSFGIQVKVDPDGKIRSLTIELDRDQHRGLAIDAPSLWFSGNDK